MQTCLLCGARRTAFYHQDKKRTYYQCELCELVFVPTSFHLSEADEKAEYDLHRNDPADEGYRRFLERVTSPLVERLAQPSCGLDFGCGPGPALHHLLGYYGHSVALYDKFYASDEDVLHQSYDFITATEVVEHLAAPGDVLNALWRQIKPGGVFAIMTKRVLSAEAFAVWHYKNDPTHICFFSEATFAWLARQWGARYCLPDKDVVFIEKPE